MSNPGFVYVLSFTVSYGAHSSHRLVQVQAQQVVCVHGYVNLVYIVIVSSMQASVVRGTICTSSSELSTISFTHTTHLTCIMGYTCCLATLACLLQRTCLCFIATKIEI